MSEIDISQRARLNIPKDGKWFWKQNDMLTLYQNSGGITLAWAKENGANAYGVYSGLTREGLMAIILSNPPEKRLAFELIPRDTACKAYIDMEWTSPPDPMHDGLTRAMKVIRKHCKDSYGLDAEIYVCCGSRPDKNDGSLVNHSYHVVIDNLHFTCNHDNRMKSFFTLDHPDLFIPDGSPAGKYMIDLAVYTPNRLFRLPLNCKYGRNVPFRRISGDPFADDFTKEWGLDIPAVIPFFLVNPEKKENFVISHAPLGGRQASEQAVQSTTQTRKRPRIAEDLRPLPFPMQVLRGMLTESGDNVSNPSGGTWNDHEEAWQIQCNQGKNPRKCLVDPSKVHDSNNCILFVSKFQGRLKVKYHCTSASCSGCSSLVLGYVSLGRDMEWQHQLSSLNDGVIQDPPAGGDAPEQTGETGDDSSNTGDEAEIPEAPMFDPDNPATNTYALVKARFELECFKVEMPFCYARIKKGYESEPCTFSHAELRQFFCDWTYWKTDEDDTLKKKGFIDDWLKDPFKKTVRALVVDPAGTMTDVYNMWKGFRAATLPVVTDRDIPELIQPIITHINDVITKGNASHTEWLLDYLANMIQRPEKKSQVAVSLYGEEGCGKGILFEFFRLKVLGSHCSYQTAKPENCLFGRFSNGAVNRVCIQVDEVKSLHEHHDQLKDFITNPTLNYERKGKDGIVLSNIANLILTSNNANALTISPNDRRFVLFECSPVHKRDQMYMSSLGRHLGRQEVARAFFQHLLSRDLSAYPDSFQYSRPITEYYKTTQQNSIPVVSRFFSGLVNGTRIETIGARGLYQWYQKFHTAGNYKFVMTETAFGREIKKINGVIKTRENAGVYYRLCFQTIRKYLEDSHEYDPDADVRD